MGITAEEIEAGSESFELLKAKAKEMGASTKYTASEAAEGLNILAMAGLSAEEAVGSIGDVLNLAGAGALSLEQSASYLTGAVKGFNDEMSNSAYYADLMAKGATMANTNVDALGAALSGAAASANAYGQSAESTTLALLRLAEQNVTGSEAATAMNRAMADLYTPTDQAATALEELGIKTFEANGDARDFNVVVDELNGRLATMSEEEKLAYESSIFTTFGMKAFQKMTVSTTEKVKEFSDGLKKASGSAMQQYATQTDNLEGKMAILNSALEALGIQIYDIFSETLKESVGEGTEAVERLQEAVSEGKLGDSLEHLAESFSDLVEKGIELGESALPVLVDGLAMIIDALPVLIGGFAGLKTAQLGYEAATIAATIATEGLGAVLSVNPIGLVVSAIGMLSGALIGYVSDLKATAQQHQEELLAITDSTEKSIESMQSALEASKTSMSDIGSQTEYVTKLKNELADLNTKEKLTETQKGRLKTIVSQLNSIYTDLNLQIDEETGKLDENSKGWEKNIEERIKLAKFEAVMEQITALTKEQVEADIQLQENEKTYQDLLRKRQEIHDALQRANTGASGYDERTGQSSAQLIDDLNDTETQIKALDGAMAEHQQVLDDTGAEIDHLNQYIEDNNLAQEENKETTEASTKAMDEQAQAAQELAEEIQKETEKLAENLAQQATSFDKVSEAAKQKKADILKNLQENQQAVAEWSENMQTLMARGINDGILQELANMGPAGAGYVQAFLDMTGDELKQANDTFTKSLTISTDAAGVIANGYMTTGQLCTQKFIDGLWVEVPTEPTDEIANRIGENLANSPEWERMPDAIKEQILNAHQTATDAIETADMGDAGKAEADSVIDNYAAEMEARTGDVEAATKTSTDAVKNTLETELGTTGGTASTVTTETGDQVTQGLTDGIKTGTELHIIPQVKQTAKEIIETLNTELAASNFESIGSNVAAGIAAGIKANAHLAKDAATGMAGEVEGAAKTKLEVESPSKVFKEIGAYCVAGFAEGLSGFESVTRDVEASLTVMQASNQQAQAPVPVTTQVILEGDAAGVFNLVRSENASLIKTTGYHALA